MKTLLILFITAALTLTASAQTGNCPRALGEAYLDINNVRARIVNTGGLFYRGSPSVYNVPKQTESNAIFSSNIWFGGMIDNTLHISASRYGEWEMWGGPLDTTGAPPTDCAAYDRIYKVNKSDLLAYDATGFTTPDLRDWPVELGAPVIDGDGIPDNYDLAAGDRPEVLGHQTLWWIMNDRGNMHESTQAPAVGLEVRVTAFASQSDNPAINNTTFYRYKLKYRGVAPLTDAYFGIFSDPDLGDFADDFVGSDTTHDMGYVYNADNEDISNVGYGTAPPAAGYRFLKGAPAETDGADNDHDGMIDEPGEHLGMTAFVYYFGGGGIAGDPQTGQDYHLLMQGRWKDGRPMLYGGDGFETGTTNTPTRFMFSGNPETGEGWSEVNPGADGTQPPNPPADRRFIQATGPFDMQPGDEEEIAFAVIWAKGENNLHSVTALKTISEEVQSLYDAVYTPPLPDPPAKAVQLISPANSVTGQFSRTKLHWQATGDLDMYQLQWSSNPDLPDSGAKDFLTKPSFELTTLNADSTYYWRVRSFNAGGYGPWSDTWSFSTATHAEDISGALIAGFMTTHNAAGPIEPPDMAAFAINNSGFPVLEGNLTPVGAYPDPELPTRGVQQATNDGIWGIHTGGQGRVFYGESCYTNPGDCDGGSFITRSIRRGWTVFGIDTYEWRFTQACLDGINNAIESTDCLAFRRFEDEKFMEVPFELWNIGEIADETDDYQMIPVILCEFECSENPEDGKFSIGGDHDISGGDNDPYSDWIYWYKPADNGLMPGSQGYQDFFASDTFQLGDEVMSRTVLVLLDGGSTPPYTATQPEPGTTFRIVNRGAVPTPAQSAPSSGALNLIQPVSLYWSGRQDPVQLQVAMSEDFSDPIVSATDLNASTYTLPQLDRNQTYYWRLRLASETSNTVLSDWSPTWQFSVSDQVVNVENHDHLPTNFALEANYPNPFTRSTTIRFALPREAEVQLEVYDLLGRRVRVITAVHQPAGWHEALFDATGLTSGVYFYRLSTNGFTKTRSMILLN